MCVCVFKVMSADLSGQRAWHWGIPGRRSAWSCWGSRWRRDPGSARCRQTCATRKGRGRGWGGGPVHLPERDSVTLSKNKKRPRAPLSLVQSLVSHLCLGTVCGHLECGSRVDQARNTPHWSDDPKAGSWSANAFLNREKERNVPCLIEWINQELTVNTVLFESFHTF